jgi:hypothetical protein
MLWTCRPVQPVASDDAASTISEIAMYATISRRNSTWPSIFHAQRRFRIQLGTAPATNAAIVQTVVFPTATYISANTMMLVSRAMTEPIA